MLATTAPLIKESSPRAAGRTGDFSRHVALGMLAAGAILLIGSLMDLGTLWLLQRQDTLQWELVALLNTAEAFPRLVLSAGFLYAALYFRRSTSLLAYRGLAAILTLLGLAGAGVALLLGMDYFALAPSATAQALPRLQSVVLKGVLLGGLYFLLLTPLGMLGFRAPKANKR